MTISGDVFVYDEPNRLVMVRVADRLGDLKVLLG